MGTESSYQRKEAAKKAANDLMDFLNDMSVDKQTFAETILNSHRTLQQGLFKVFMILVKSWALAYKERRYDLRNEATCERAAAMLNGITAAGLEPDVIPFI